MSTLDTDTHAALMDGVYRRQRHIYDLTRKHYLLGRDRLIGELDPPPGGTVLELGCGTGRNLVLAARRHPRIRLFGLDISGEMLASADTVLRRNRLAPAVRLAKGDATTFDSRDLFGEDGFDRVLLSYALSMIPAWQDAIAAAIAALNPGGSLHVVDFGGQERLPPWFRAGLRAWLARFHVTPRDTLRIELESQCQRVGATLSFATAFRGYAALATVRRAG